MASGLLANRKRKGYGKLSTHCRTGHGYAEKLQAWGWPSMPNELSPARAWAGESCRLITQRNTYPTTTELDHAYLDANRPLAEQRVRQAAFRLAYSINAVLDR
jgi:nuclease S1